jgi:hypothetical protein
MNHIDAEGTLGGLIQVGRQIHEVVRSALEMGTPCSNHPVCAQHEPAVRMSTGSCTVLPATAAF